jgi:adenine-specific DNA glycosylase
MSAITLDQAQAKLSLWMAADDALTMGQNYTIDQGNVKRVLTRADAAEIRNNINYWRREVERLTANGTSAPVARFTLPRDI